MVNQSGMYRKKTELVKGGVHVVERQDIGW